MKMSDVFKLPMVCEDGDGFIYSKDLRHSIQFDDSDTYMMDHKKAVTHAINNHDRMADEIAELRAKIAKKDEMVSDLIEALGASVDDTSELREMVKLYKLSSDEVTKYKHVLSYNESYAGEPEGEIKNNLAELDMISCKAIQLLAKHK